MRMERGSCKFFCFTTETILAVRVIATAALAGTAAAVLLFGGFWLSAHLLDFDTCRNEIQDTSNIKLFRTTQKYSITS